LESIDIDYYAQMSQFYSISPYSKIFFSLTSLIISIAAPSLIVPAVCFSVFTFLTLFSKTPRRLYFFLLAMIFLFAVFNLAVFSFFLGKEILLGGVFGFLNIYKDGLNLGLLLFFRMLAGFACLYFLISTTPSTQLFSALRKIGIPEAFLEIMVFIYRYIFLLIEDASKMMVSLRSREGSTFGESLNEIRRLGSFMANLFVRAFEKEEKMWISMTSRCYDGKYSVLNVKNAGINELIPVISFDLVLIILALRTQDFVVIS